MSEKETKLELGSSGYAAGLYQSVPCTVGYSYIRFEVDGRVKPCCVVRHFMGDASTTDWRLIWHSLSYEMFRSKLLRIHTERFHLQDPEWFACQYCSHFNINRENAEFMSK